MSDETPGVSQGALPPREGQMVPSRAVTERPTMRLTQVAGGQYLITTSQPHGGGVPALAQISSGTLSANIGQGGSGSITRIISISPSRGGMGHHQASAASLRPSVANQSIVNVLTKSSRPVSSSNNNTNTSSVRQQLFNNNDGGVGESAATILIQQQQSGRSPVKRLLPSAVAASSSAAVTISEKKKDSTFASKLQRVMNHRIVRSKLVKEKYNEHLMEQYYLKTGGNILDLYQFAKKPKTQAYLNYLKEHAIIDAKSDFPPDSSSSSNNSNNTIQIPPSIAAAPPSATAVSSLPGISSHNNSQITTNTSIDSIMKTSMNHATPVKTIINKSSTPLSSTSSSASIGTSSNHPNSNSATTTTTNQEQIVEKAKQEAYVVQRISDLQKEGLWSEKRLPKVQEMHRTKAHWDFLLEEMVWLAADFAQERKWKKAAAKKCARMVQKYFQDKALAAHRAEKAQEQHLRRIAGFCAKEIRLFWNNVEKLVEYKQHTILEEKRKKALDQQLSFIVDQTEKYSQLLAEGMMNRSSNFDNNIPPPASNVSSRSGSHVNSDDDEFRPDDEQNSTDDEETIAQEEAAADGLLTTEEKKEEVAALQRESEMDLDDFLKELPADYLQNRQNIQLSDNSEDDDDNDNKSTKSVDNDEEFALNITSDEEDDDEDTIQEQERLESDQDHEKELDDLKAENDMSIEELRKKYSGTLPAKHSDSEDDDDDDSDATEDLSDNDEDIDVESDDNEIEMDVQSQGGENDEDDIGLKSLLLEEDSHIEGETTKTDQDNDLINDAAAIAESIQPKGNTLSSTSVSTKVPFLLKFPLREYQHIGLDWLVTMYDRKLNGILADEMGLGKTIQTIALLAHLACEKEDWGPHLIVVPTSVMLNWEMECKKWCPAFKILTYYGTQKERKLKRTGWTKPNAFHICITSYKLVIQDHQSFRRKKWKYLILDEAQNIKNFKSQRWQLLLNFQTQQRLLLTGTPLQNNLMELWSLMHFLMPNVFQSHREFKEWFSNPVTGMIEGNSEYNENIIKRLHKVLRPFLLRRLKSEVEKQMPKKYEHVIMCRLSKRQRFLYDDYMSRAKTRETLVSGNLLSVINVLMQLRKVCNHPNLFEVRPTISPFQCDGIILHIPSLVYAALEYDVFKQINLYSINLNLIMMEFYLSAYQCYRMQKIRTPRKLIELMSVKQSMDTRMIPMCPPSRLLMRVRKGGRSSDLLLTNKSQQHQQNVKVKVAQQYGVQLVQQQGIVKAIPVNISNNNNNNSQSSSSTTATSMLLKQSDKISASFAQLVQTSTGKHLLLTSNPNISGNIPVSTSAGGGHQKLTFLSKQPVLTPSSGSNISHPITKAYVKIQLTSSSVAASTANTATTTAAMATSSKITGTNIDSINNKTVGTKFIEQLYANQSNSLDVRWNHNNDESIIDNNSIDDSDDDEGDIRNRLKIKFEILARLNEQRCSAVPLYGEDFRQVVQISSQHLNYNNNDNNNDLKNVKSCWSNGYQQCDNVLNNENFSNTTMCLKDFLYTPERRLNQLRDICDRFIFYVPAVRASEPELHVWHPSPSTYWGLKQEKRTISLRLSKPATSLHPIASAMITQFPDPRLIQYDCGKLQTLDKLLRKLKCDSHRVLIFTQMTKMLDVLEAFLNFHGHIYLRLDGTTKVDQRQLLMERFNGDTRIFVFILSTRSGGVGVNLTGADTVIFYDSDWNPTMDAQAQDRCHRIGQTRDVHIYRLISERTIEENILKKANQKRLLGNLAIEGGNFTTAYFKSSTIQDLFNIDANEESAANRMNNDAIVKDGGPKRSEPSTSAATAPSAGGDEKVAIGAFENALAACEDDQDVQAACTAKAEAVADLAEFDENIPLLDDPDKDNNKEPEVMSKAEQEIDNVIKKLSPIERYAMRFIEETESAWSAEQLAAAAREIDEQKREWEQNRLAAMREEEERRARELEEENNDLLTFSREDSTNQIWVSDNTMEQMPMWCPPTPPQQDSDIYIDQTMSFLYDTNIMSESQLPPIYIKKETKRTRNDAGFVDSRRPLKIPRKDDIINAPKSLFHSAALLKMKRDMKLQKYRGLMRPTVSQIPGKPSSVNTKPAIEQPLWHDWTIHEDVALLKVIQSLQGLPLNLLIMSAGHTPNWDFVADYVNTVSITYRSSKQCRHRYESVLMQREEGKQVFDNNSMRKKKNKSGGGVMQKYPNTFQHNKSSTHQQRPMRTSQLYTQDNNATFSQIMIQRYDIMRSVSNKRISTTRSATTNNPLLKNPKHIAVLNECGIDLDHPILPTEIAARRAERLAREKKPLTIEQQQQMATRLHLMKGVLSAAAAAASGSSGSSSNSNQQQQQQQQQQSNNSSSNLSQQQIVTSVASSTAVVSQQQQSNIQVTTQTLSLVPTNVITTQQSSNSNTTTPPNALRAQRIIASSPLQTSTVVSVSGLSPAQFQAATQRLIVSAGGPHQTKTIVGTTTAGGLQGKTISPAHLQMIRQQAQLKQHLRLQAAAAAQGGGVKTSTVTIGSGGQAVVQFTQATAQQQRGAQFVRQQGVGGTVTVGGKTGLTRTVTDSEVAQLLKKQQQQQKALAAAVAAGGNQQATGSGGGNIQTLSPQVFAQAMQQAGGGNSGGVAQVATLVKTVSNAGGVTQTVTIPVSGVTLGHNAVGKTLTTTTLKGTSNAQQQIRQFQIQQQLLAQKKLGAQKLNIAHVGGNKNTVQTQLIVGSKPLSTAMTVQQFTQVMRSPLGGVSGQGGPVVLAKGSPRVIPVVNTSQGGTKQTIQVVAAATSQGLTTTTLRPQAGSSSTLAGALAGIKVQGQTSSQALLSQVSAALQSQNVRQSGSPVRLQTSTGTPIVAVTVQPNISNLQQQQQQSSNNTINSEQVSRFLKK